jgi:methionine synthase I (cobalamin-dependent)
VIALDQALRERVLLFNTCTGHTGWAGDYDPLFALNQPEHLLTWTRQLVDAGTDIIEAHTYDANTIACEVQCLDVARFPECNREGVRIAREAGAGNFVVGAVRDGMSLLTVMPRGHSVEEYVGHFRDHIRQLWSAGVDAIHLVFFNDAKNIEAAFVAIDSLQQELGCRIPAILTLDVPFHGLLLSGQTVEQLCSQIAGFSPLAFGLATYGSGGDELRHVRQISDVPVGLLLDPFPYAIGVDLRPASWLAEVLEPLLAEGLLSYCGLSCTVPSIDYVKAVAALIARHVDRV